MSTLDNLDRTYIDTIVFDLGGVLIDWDPRHLYRKLLKSEEEISWFLQNICTSDWNDQQDAGTSMQQATIELMARHPEWEKPIRAWWERWQETIKGPIHESVDILRAIRNSKRFRLYALTNWSAETFPWALENFEFLHWFQGIVVSGVEKTRKPFPEFYNILFTRYGIEPSTTLFIDDNVRNVEAARKLGVQTIHFQSPDQLQKVLQHYKILD